MFTLGAGEWMYWGPRLTLGHLSICFIQILSFYRKGLEQQGLP